MCQRKYVTVDEIESIDCMNANERETSISISYSEDKMLIFTSENTTMTKLKRNFLNNPGEWKCWEGPRNKQGHVTGYFIEAPKQYISFRVGERKVTENQKEKASERFKNLAKQGRLGRPKKIVD